MSACLARLSPRLCPLLRSSASSASRSSRPSLPLSSLSPAFSFSSHPSFFHHTSQLLRLVSIRTAHTGMDNAWQARAGSNDELVDQLKDYGIIQTARVEQAMRAVDRGRYSRDPEQAYKDNPHSIGYGATISAPHMHAYCLEWLKDVIKPGSRVLDVGSGSGYLTACFAAMCEGKCSVLGIDIIPELVDFAINNVKNDHPEYLESGAVKFQHADGWQAISDKQFDAIHVGAAAATLPEALVKALANGGKMVIPLGQYEQKLFMVSKDANGSISQHALLDVMYVPLVKGKLKPNNNKGSRSRSASPRRQEEEKAEGGAAAGEQGRDL